MAKLHSVTDFDYNAASECGAHGHLIMVLQQKFRGFHISGGASAHVIMPLLS